MILNKNTGQKTTCLSVKLTTVLIVMSSLHMSAQRPSGELSVFGGWGLSALQFETLSTHKFTDGVGQYLGAGFTFFFDRQLAIHVGGEYGQFEISAKANELRTLTAGLTNVHGQRFDLYTTLHDYEEYHETRCLSIPVLLQLQTKRASNSKTGFYALGGIKINIPLSFTSDYNSSVQSLHNVAYYPDFDLWTTAGFGHTEGRTQSESFDIDPFVMATLEMGLKLRISEDVFLYMGAFFDYGLNDPARNTRTSLSNYTAPESLPDLTLLAFADRINIAAMGVKIRLTFTTASTPKDDVPKPRAIPPGARPMVRGHCPHYR